MTLLEFIIFIFNHFLLKRATLIDINKKNEMVIKNISDTFMQQEQQVKELKNSIESSPYKVIVSGDLNNTAFSYVYKELSKTSMMHSK